jgi:reductive dehalogenase
MRLFSYKNRAIAMGPLPYEKLKRTGSPVDLSTVTSRQPLEFRCEDNPASLVNAMQIYAAYMDASRNGPVSDQMPDIPACPQQRAEQVKSMGYFMDALQVSCCSISGELLLNESYINPHLSDVENELHALPPERPGFHHHIAHELDQSIESNAESIQHHTHTIVLIYDVPRELQLEESAYDWLADCGLHRGSIRASETAVVLANYIRALGFEARAHTESTTDIDLARAAVAAGAAEIDEKGRLHHPYLGQRFAVAAVTTTLEVAADQPLAPRGLADSIRSHGPAWMLGRGKASGTLKNAFNLDPYKHKSYERDIYGLDRIKRRQEPTTLIDEPRIPRVPKRHDVFWRANFGDMGKAVQDACVDEFCVVKTASAEAQYGLIGSLHLLERRTPAADKAPGHCDPRLNAKKIKSALHYLGADMVGISEAPDWVWYSHDLDGSEIHPPHKNAITLLIDQGHETMEGASGDDWIAASQSMRAYLRGMLLGGIVAEQIRNLGYSASTHSVVDSDVIHTPLVLLSGLGEISRIGDTALNPFLGPRLKTLVITTDMPLEADKPIDFGLQAFCNACKKCARECPSGAISAGPKVMFNGYETWKADVEKCGRYRMTQDQGAMCGRCMKTCPWNLEGLFVESPFRWLAMKVPQAAKGLTWLDDKLGHGNINPMKKWWWDIETTQTGVKQVVPEERINVRELNLDLDLQPEDQTLACYPADMAPAPVPIVQPMDRELAIERYQNLLSPEEYQAKLDRGDTDNLVPVYQIPEDTPDVQYLRIAKREMSAEGVVRFELESPDGRPLTPFTAGAHIDLVIDAPFTRQYSLAGDPADRSKYVLGILKEPEGRGGSFRAHERLFEGAIVPVTGPRNHFELEASAKKTLLFGGGIGITPMMAMGHHLYAIGADFDLHYSFRSRSTAGFIEELLATPWADRVHLHISAEGTRADLAALIGAAEPDKFLYTCGPNAFMDAVLTTGETLGWDEDNLRREYFSAPEHDEYENFPFKVKIASTGKTIDVPAEKSLAEVLEENHIPVITKCNDGICGVCSTRYIEGDVEHRDFVLSRDERREHLITCCSRVTPESEQVLVLDR